LHISLTVHFLSGDPTWVKATKNHSAVKSGVILTATPALAEKAHAPKSNAGLHRLFFFSQSI
jgi:hypothetical protein